MQPMCRSLQGLCGLGQEITRGTLVPPIRPPATNNYDQNGRSLDYIRQIRSEINLGESN
jgi:hypothetical protein